jgi:hypothetical protein
MAKKSVKLGPYTERGVCAVDSSADDFAVVYEDAAYRSFVGCEGEFGHFDGFAHEDFVVFTVGDWTEDHDRGGLMG